MFDSFLVLDEAEAVTCPSSSQGCVNMLQTTRYLEVAPRGQASEALCGISVLCTSVYFWGGDFFLACYDETILLQSIITNKEELNDSEQNLQASRK